MADSVKQILVEFLFDLSKGTAAVEDFFKQLSDVNDQQDQASQKASVNQQQSIANWQVLAAQIRSAIATESDGVEEIKQKREGLADLLTNEIGLLSQKANLNKEELASLRSMTLELERQKSALGGGPGVTQPFENMIEQAMETFTGKMEAFRGFSKGLGMGGAGMVMGGGIGASIVLASEKMGELVKEISDLVTESGQLEHVTETFTSLSSAIGSVPTEMLSKLHDATGGLVNDMNLMKSANQVLLQGIPITEDQIVSLTGSVTKLATAQGKDATEAMELLSRGLASGRTSMLAYYLGLQDTTKEQLRLDQELPQSLKYWAQYQTILAAVNEQNERIGPQQDTITDEFQKMHVAISDFFEELGKDIADSPFGGWISSMTEMVTKFVETLGKMSNPLFGANTSVFRQSTEWNSLSDTDKQALAKEGKGDPDKIRALLSKRFEKNFASTDISGKPINENAVQDAIKKLQGGTSGPGLGATIDLSNEGGLKPSTATPPDYDAQKKSADAYFNYLKEQLTGERQLYKQSMDYWLEINQEAYKNGEESFKSYIHNIRDLQSTNSINQIADIEKEKKAALAKYDADQGAQTANLKDLLSTAQATGNAPQAGQLQSQLNQIGEGRKAVEEKYNNQILQLRGQLQLELAKLDQQERVNRDQIEDESVKNQQQQANEKIATAKQALQDQFQQGTVSAQDYVKQQQDLLDQSLEAFLAEKAHESEAFADDSAGKLKIWNEMTDQIQKTWNEKITLGLKLPQLEWAQMQKDFQLGSANAEAQIKLAQLPSAQGGGKSFGGRSAAPVDVDAMNNALAAGIDFYRTEMAKIIGLLNSPEIPKGSNEWRELVNELDTANEKIRQLAQQMVTWNDITSTFLGGLSNATSRLKVTGLSEGLSAAGGLFSSLGNFQKQAQPHGGTAVPGSNISGFDTGASFVSAPGGNSNMFGAMFDSIKDIFSSGKDGLKTNVQNFGKALSEATTQVGTLVYALKGIGASPIESGISGAAAGFTTTKELGDAAASGLQGLGAISAQTASSISSAMGPIGAAVGLVSGIISTFSAKAEKRAQEMAQMIQKQFDKLINSLNTGNTTLDSAIQQAQEQEAQAIASLSGQKGGQSQLNQILPQMEQTIASLQSKQQQIFKSMQETLNEIYAPQPYQQTINQIQQLIDTYNQYINAGGDVATANQFLADSYNNLAQSSLQQLNQDQQQAIQDALSYKNLLIQQAQAAAEFANSLNSLLSNGAATRTPTRAMNEMVQITNLENQYQQQQEQMGMELQTLQYKLSVEQQIFSLATTRIGLEQQLVALQNQQTAQSMAQIVALKQLVATLQSGTPITAVSILTSLLGLGASPTVPGINYAPGSAEATNSGNTLTPTTASQVMEELVLSLYSQMGSQGLGNFFGEQ